MINQLKRKLNLDIFYFVKGGMWAFLQQIIGVSSGLLVSYLFGHFVSKTVFGQYNLILSFLGMLTFLSLSGIDPALTRSVSLGFDGSLIESQRLKLKASFLGLPILLAFALIYYSRNLHDVAMGLVIATLLFPFLNSYTNYPAFLTAKKSFGTLSFLTIFSSIFFLLCLGISIFFLPTTVGLISAYLLAMIIPSYISFTYSKHFIKNNKKDPSLPSYGIFLTAISALPWISGNLGQVLLANNLGVEALAIYSVSSRFLTAVQKNFIVFYKPITAKLAEQTSSQHLVTLRQHSMKLIFIGTGLMLCLWFTTPILISFFFTTAYSEAIRYGQWLSLALIPLPINWVLADIILYQKKKLPQVISSTILPIAKILLFFIIIPRWKIVGLVGIVLGERFLEPLISLTFLLTSYKNQPSVFQ